MTYRDLSLLWWSLWGESRSGARNVNLIATTLSSLASSAAFHLSTSSRICLLSHAFALNKPFV